MNFLGNKGAFKQEGQVVTSECDRNKHKGLNLSSKKYDFPFHERRGIKERNSQEQLTDVSCHMSLYVQQNWEETGGKKSAKEIKRSALDI